MMFKDKYIHKLYAFALAALFALTLAGCGGGGGGAATPDPEPPPVPPTAYEVAVDAIAAAETEAAARAAVATAVAAGISGTELQDLNTKVDERVAALAMMARIDAQKMALANAAGMIDTSDLSTQAAVDAAEAAIAALKAAIAAAADVDDTSMYDAQVTAAETAVANAQSMLDHAAQTTALADAVTALQAIDLTDLSTQEKIDDAQGAIDALQTALDNATELSAAEKRAAMTELATANRNVMLAQGRTDLEVQRMALSSAVEGLQAIDLTDLSTQEKIDDAEAAIVALELALEQATDLTDAEKLDATVDVTVAKRRVASAQETLTANVGTQRTALADAAGMIDTSDLSTQEKIDAANAGIRALRQALEDAVNVPNKSMYQRMLDDAIAAVDSAQGGIDTATRRTNQTTALSDASTTLQAALAALAGSTPTQEQLDAANNALTALNAAITGGADLTDAEKATYVREATNAAAPIQTAQAAFDKAEDDAQKAADAEMMEDARKLYAGISVQTGTAGSPAVGDRIATYNTAGTAIEVSAGLPTTAPAAVTLSEDKDAPDVTLHGWARKRYADPAGGDSYEAVVYSNVGEPTEGKKFGGTGAQVTANEVEYELTDGALAIDTTDAAVAGRVASPSFDQSAGTKVFKKDDNEVARMIPGSYHGVSGTYSCTPTTGTNACSATVAADGFTLTGGTWTFKPTDANDRLMETPDGNYASYGWWLYKSADGDTFIASAFVDDRGDGEGAASGITALQGTATYMGGAAGKYALHSTTGGANDAGHFTADVTLEADFGDDMITGTIDNFMGADGESRDWSVKLNETDISDTGDIDGLGGAANDEQVGTVWTRGGTAAAKSGQWSGALYGNGDDGVPQVATGTFYTEFNRDGKMVGGFGVKKQ